MAQGSCTLIFALITLYLMNDGLNNSRKLNQVASTNASLTASLNDLTLSQNQRISISLQIAQNLSSIQNLAIETEQSFHNLYIINLFLVLYFIRGITLLLYSKIRNKRLIFDGSFLLSIINTFCVTYSFIRYYTSYSVGADKSTATGTMSILQRGLNDGILRITISNTISMCIQWIYVLIVLKASKTFGPMIETINTMIVNILKFSCIFCLIRKIRLKYILKLLF